MRQRGSAFILALGVVAGLVAILATIASTQRTALRAQINRTETVRARLAAEAAIQRAIAQIGLIEANSPTLTTDDWATLGNKGDDRFVVGDSTFRMEIADASSRLNINTATEGQLQRLPLTEDQVEAILDFREGGNTPRPQGAKDEYYNSLLDPYNAKERRLDTVDELLQVKGITPDVLFNPQTNITGSALTQGPIDDQPVLYDLLTTDSASPVTTSTGTTKLNVNAATVTAATLQQRLRISQDVANSIVQGRTYARLGDVLARPGVTPQNYQVILDNLTLSTGTQVEGKINLNTVTEAVLNSIPELTPDMVTAILQRQSSGGFTSLGDIISVPGMNTLQVLQPTVDLFTTTSNTFLVEALGTAGDTSIPIEALIVIQNNQPRIQWVRDYPLNDPIQRWGWQDQPTSDVVLLQPGGTK